MKELRGILRVWKDWRLRVTLGLAVVAAVFGFIGFRQSDAALGQSHSILDTIYDVLQLIPLQSGDVSSVPWMLQIARFLEPALAGYAAITALALLFRRQLVELWIRLFVRDHVVVCGLGRLGVQLVREFRRAKHTVVVFETDGNNYAIGECRELGARVIVGNATDPTVLRRGCLDKARYLFAVLGDDGSNAKVAIDASELAVDRPGRRLTCHVHLLDAALCDLLRQLELEALSDGSIRLEYFNAAELGVPVLLDEHPPFDISAGVPPVPPHIVLVGAGQMGSRLVVNAAGRWRAFRGDSPAKMKVTIVDNKAGHHVRTLRMRYRFLADVCELVGEPMDVADVDFEAGGFLFDEDRRCDVSVVYVCLGDDTLGVEAGLMLRRRLRPRETPIVVRTTQYGGLGTLLGTATRTDPWKTVRTFNLLDRISAPTVVLAGANEVLARAIHEDYLLKRLAEGKTLGSKRSMAAWDQLPEDLKESNRDQAADIGRKLRAAGCAFESTGEWVAPLTAFSGEEVERLAVMEHDRWNDERTRAGWTRGPLDEAGKITPYLCPWDELPRDVQDYDRQTVANIPALLESIGYAVVRIGRGP